MNSFKSEDERYWKLSFLIKGAQGKLRNLKWRGITIFSFVLDVMSRGPEFSLCRIFFLFYQKIVWQHRNNEFELVVVKFVKKWRSRDVWVFQPTRLVRVICGLFECTKACWWSDRWGGRRREEVTFSSMPLDVGNDFTTKFFFRLNHFDIAAELTSTFIIFFFWKILTSTLLKRTSTICNPKIRQQ